MKKTFLLLAGFMLLATVAWSDEIELGIGIAPPTGPASVLKNPDPNQDSTLKVMRAAWTTLGIFNISIDSLILPPIVVSAMNADKQPVFDENFVVVDYTYKPGPFVPGMVNMVDFGIKFALFNKLVMGVQVGVNQLHLYKQDDPQQAKLYEGIGTDLGANIKVSTGWKLNDLMGIEVAMYSVQESVEKAQEVIVNLVSENKAKQKQGQEDLLSSAFFGALFVLYL